jgi:hypothetical protein
MLAYSAAVAIAASSTATGGTEASMGLQGTDWHSPSTEMWYGEGERRRRLADRGSLTSDTTPASPAYDLDVTPAAEPADLLSGDRALPDVVALDDVTPTPAADEAMPHVAARSEVDQRARDRVRLLARRWGRGGEFTAEEQARFDMLTARLNAELPRATDEEIAEVEAVEAASRQRQAETLALLQQLGL